jgi:hypothetical protein
MQAVKQVKKDIVKFVDFHKENIKELQAKIVDVEKQIKEEKTLLRDKGSAYTKILKELQDLTQSFGISRPPQQTNSKQRPQQHRQRQDYKKAA